MNIIIASIFVWIVLTYCLGWFAIHIDAAAGDDSWEGYHKIVAGIIVETIACVLLGVGTIIIAAFVTVVKTLILGG